MRSALYVRVAAVVILAFASVTACTLEDRAGPTAPDQAGALTEAAKPNGQFNEKFTFDPVTFPDETTGVIYAGSKRNKSEYTVCSYFSDQGDFLGQFASDTFSSQDPGEVLNFCLANFANRS